MNRYQKGDIMQSQITTEPIRNSNELEFAFFCIESVAEKLHKDPVKVYNALAKDSNILNSYIIPLYDVLHTQSKQYIVDSIIEALHNRDLFNMNAHPVLLQKKYTRIVTLFAQRNHLTFDTALDFFYHSDVYKFMSEGISDMHCRSDLYLVEDLEKEYATKMAV